ncbi:hypothetical protein EF808_03665 [archaeon]|nr:MAG: hypothetical protein EF808_03665 [archaeon]
MGNDTMVLHETTDMGFSVFQEERERIVTVRDALVINLELEDEKISMIAEVVFYDELLKLYKRYYDEFFVNYTKIKEGHLYDMDKNRYQRLRRLLIRKYDEVLTNLDVEMTDKERLINDHIFERAMMGLEILYHGKDVVAAYEDALEKGARHARKTQ